MAIKKKYPDEKAFHFRMPKPTWLLIKKSALMNELTMGEVLIDLIEKNRNKLNKRFDELGLFEEEKEREKDELKEL